MRTAESCEKQEKVLIKDKTDALIRRERRGGVEVEASIPTLAPARSVDGIAQSRSLGKHAVPGTHFVHFVTYQTLALHLLITISTATQRNIAQPVLSCSDLVESNNRDILHGDALALRIPELCRGRVRRIYFPDAERP